jgi:hypothetical protein
MRSSFIAVCAGALVFLGATGVTLPGTATAARLGDPGSVAAPGRFTLGVEYEFLERDVEFDAPFLGASGAELESQRLLFRGAYGIAPNLEVFLRLGPAEAETNTPNVNGDFSLAFGGGVKGVMLRGENWALGATLQMLYFNSENGGEVDVFELDAAIGASFAMGPAAPYAGLVMQWSQGEVTTAGASQDFEQENLIGIFFGINYVPQPNVSLGIEAHIIHETSVSIAMEARF